jgi:hypothetical protein
MQDRVMSQKSVKKPVKAKTATKLENKLTALALQKNKRFRF